MNKNATILFLFGILISSCSITKNDLPEDKSKILILLPFKLNELNIVDGRDSMKSMNWTLPPVIPKNKEWIGNPEISQQNKDDIERIVRSTEPKENGISANFEIKILEGECKLKPERDAIREYTKFKADLTLTVPGRSKKYGAIAEGYFDNAVFNGSKEHTIQLYNLLVRNVTAELMKVLRDEVKQ